MPVSTSSSWVVNKHSELYLPTQHAIYAHLWQKLHDDFSDRYSKHTEALEPNLQLCEILATSSHVLARDMLKRNSEKLFGSTEARGRISICDTLSRMFQNEVCSIAILDKLYPTKLSQQGCFFDSLQVRYGIDGHVHAQCTQWLEVQALELINSCASLSITRCLAPCAVLHKNTYKVKDSSAALNDDTDAVDTGLAYSSRNGGPQLCNFVDEPSKEPKESVYLYSSSIQSSMRSFVSMASRIQRNTQESALLAVSQMSSGSMAMSISGSFDFSRVTGMGSATLPDHSMDIMETEEEVDFEPGLILTTSVRDLGSISAALMEEEIV